MTSALRCLGVSVDYPGNRVLSEVNLEVGEGETLALLGPSGSGKTTLMYAIAGFIEPTTGEIEIGGKTVFGGGTSVPPERRDIGLVFQNYALWPHMTAAETVAYPLRRSGLAKVESMREALRLLAMMDIVELSHRKPSELSGGQQQRVGLARALARRAGLYLFDEPTAHLDAFLRSTLQDEILRRRSDSAAAAVYSTHDSAEALAISHRVAILRSGSVIQEGSPKEVYERPIDEWAARLTGIVSALPVNVGESVDGRAEVDLGNSRMEADVAGGCEPGETRMLVRPEWVTRGGPVTGVVVGSRFRGPHTDYAIETSSGILQARISGSPAMALGDQETWSIDQGWIPPS